MSDTIHIDMSKPMLKHTQPTFHILCVNAFGWRSGDNLHDLMKAMDKEKHTYWVWYVPGANGIPYAINFYQPQVEGAFVLAQVEPKRRK
jgi:hypothetical protein